jgi:hypothetical protein
MDEEPGNRSFQFGAVGRQTEAVQSGWGKLTAPIPVDELTGNNQLASARFSELGWERRWKSRPN